MLVMIYVLVSTMVICMGVDICYLLLFNFCMGSFANDVWNIFCVLVLSVVLNIVLCYYLYYEKPIWKTSG